MSISKQIASHLRSVYTGGNWTASNLKDQLKDISWQEASIKIHDCNTIVTLVYHITYYVNAVTKVLQGEPLNAKDKYSFEHPPLQSQEDWERLQNRIFEEGEQFAQLIEQLSDEQLLMDFDDPQYGNYYRNLAGIIEHHHYHLGQIVILKKMVSIRSKG